MTMIMMIDEEMCSTCCPQSVMLMIFLVSSAISKSRFVNSFESFFVTIVFTSPRLVTTPTDANQPINSESLLSVNQRIGNRLLLSTTLTEINQYFKSRFFAITL